MSFIFGVWSFNKGLNVADELQKMHEAVKFMPHEKYNIQIKSQAGFGNMLTYNTPESIHEVLPVYLEEQKILFTAQGRIDNREQLLSILNIKLDSRCTDGFLILQTFLKWGKNSVNYLRGDWSFAALDMTNQELFIGRDPMGYTSIYYLQNKHGFFFSSVLKCLLALPCYQAKLNEEHFVRKLILWDDDTKAAHSTFYSGIFSLPTNHTLTLRNTQLSITQFWQPQNAPIRNYKDKDEYTEELLALFTNAVKARLRSYKPVAAMLSGGLDSSAVAFTAADMLKKEHKSLTTFSHVPLYNKEVLCDDKRRTRILDETPFIDKIVRASGNISPHYLDSSDYSIVQSIGDWARNFNNCPHGSANLYWVSDIYRKTAQAGFGSLLSGEGGNGSISFAAIDYLLPWSFQRFTQNPYIFFKKQVAKPMLLGYFNNVFNKARGVNNGLGAYVSNIFIRDSVLEKYGVIEDIKTNKKDVIPYYSNITKLKQLFIELYRPRSESGAAQGHFYGFELRDPTTDVDLMEYFFSIPNEAFFDEYYNNRMLVKRMMKRKIPDAVLHEKKKGLQSADIAYRVKAQAPEITLAIEAVKNSSAAGHYIDTKKLHETWLTYLHQPYIDPYQIQRLLKALHFAMFLQQNFD